MTDHLQSDLTALRRMLEVRNARIETLEAALKDIDVFALPTPEQIEQMETGVGAIYTPRMALELGMKTAIANVKRAIGHQQEPKP